MTPKEIRLQQKFGFVFQQPVLFDWRTVKKNVELPLEIMYQSKEDRSKRADEMLEMVGLKNFFRSLSQTAQRRYAAESKYCPCFWNPSGNPSDDEPFSALDEFTKEKLHEDLLRIWRQTNKTIVFVTHNIQEAVFLSDRICVLSPHPGRLSAIVDVDLPRPRTLEMKESPRFTELVYEVRGKLKEAASDEKDT